MSNFIIQNDVIKGSSKITGFEMAIEALDIWQFTVTNDATAERDGEWRQKSVQRFSGLAWVAPVNGDAVIALQCLASCKNIGVTTLSEVVTTGKDNDVVMTYVCGKLNGATYVTNWRMVYDPEQAPDTNGLWYAAEIVTDGIEVTGTLLEQDKSAKGNVATSMSILNQQSTGK